MYSRAARLVREQKVGKGWHGVADEKELVEGKGEVGFRAFGSAGERKKNCRKRLEIEREKERRGCGREG